MFKTRITELLDIEYPIIGGCMQYLTGPEFTATICNAGALGIMSSAMFVTKEDFRQALRELKGLTDRPFAVNLNLFPALRVIDNSEYVEVILDEGGVPIVETSGARPPENLLAELRAQGIKLMHKCISVRHALSAQKLGVDAVTLFGRDGGGHVGEVNTIPLVICAVDALDVPVIAAGGIADGRGFLAALALGAEAVTMGTRLLLSDECPIHDNLKEALLDATEHDTLITLGSVHNPLRLWKNAAALKAIELEDSGAELQDIISVLAGTRASDMFKGGDIESGVIACSQSIGSIHEIKPVAEIIRDVVEEAESAADRLAAESRG